MKHRNAVVLPVFLIRVGTVIDERSDRWHIAGPGGIGERGEMSVLSDATADEEERDERQPHIRISVKYFAQQSIGQPGASGQSKSVAIPAIAPCLAVRRHVR